MEISKRDYFAAHALTGLLAQAGGAVGGSHSPEALAARAFNHADAMLKLSRTLMDPVEIDPNRLGTESDATNDDKNAPL